MELQVGDKIVCIKGRTFYGNIYAIKNKIYNIHEISPSAILVNCEPGTINAAVYRRIAKCEKDHQVRIYHLKVIDSSY